MRLKVVRFKSDDYAFTTKGHRFFQPDSLTALPFAGVGQPYYSHDTIPDDVYEVMINKFERVRNKVISGTIGCSLIFYHKGYVFSYHENGIFYAKVSYRVLKHMTVNVSEVSEALEFIDTIRKLWREQHESNR